MLDRLRSRQRHPDSSGLATWARDQMVVRYGQAVDVNEGEPNEEPAVNEVIDVGDGTQVHYCDLPLLDAAHAADAFNTLSAATVLGQALELPSDLGDTRPSWTENHRCDHDETDRDGCTIIDLATSAG